MEQVATEIGADLKFHGHSLTLQLARLHPDITKFQSHSPAIHQSQSCSLTSPKPKVTKKKKKKNIRAVLQHTNYYISPRSRLYKHFLAQSRAQCRFTQVPAATPITDEKTHATASNPRLIKKKKNSPTHPTSIYSVSKKKKKR